MRKSSLFVSVVPLKIHVGIVLYCVAQITSQHISPWNLPHKKRSCRQSFHLKILLESGSESRKKWRKSKKSTNVVTGPFFKQRRVERSSYHLWQLFHFLESLPKKAETKNWNYCHPRIGKLVWLELARKFYTDRSNFLLLFSLYFCLRLVG